MTTKFVDLPRPERFAKVAIFLIVAGVLSIVGCVVAYTVVFRHHPIGESGDWGAFGAFISGAAGTMLSAFTLAALAFTLSLQADELAESRALANKQSKILAQQAATLNKQAFESTFFQLLHRFTMISNSLRERDRVRDFASSVLLEYTRTYDGKVDAMNRLEAAYDKTYSTVEAEFGPYFRTFFHVIKFVDTAALTSQERAEYTSLARAQLGAEELTLLFLNVVAFAEGRQGLKPLVERYGLLKHARNAVFPSLLESFKTSAIHPDAYRSFADREAAHRVSAINA